MTHLASARITGWDRAAVVALGGAGCALSYDALQQMAIAIHVRGILTYLFPLVIDGFIAYGVRALLVMRAAPLAARCYVWTLFGTATTASIWANALHAVRLNDQHPPTTGLRLDDVTVGILSTLAPLALAGAVHLYILTARHIGPGVRTDRAVADRFQADGEPDAREPVTGGQSAPTGMDSKPMTESESSGHRAGHGRTQAPGSQLPVPAGQSATRRPTPDTAGHAADPLLPVARRAVTENGRVTRQVVAAAVRGQGLPLSNDRLTQVMQQLRTEADNQSSRPTR